MSLTPFAKCVNHGFASYISLEDVQNSENYTRVVIHSPRYRVIHMYIYLHDLNLCLFWYYISRSLSVLIIINIYTHYKKIVNYMGIFLGISTKIHTFLIVIGTWIVSWIQHPPETPLSSSIMSISVSSVGTRSKIGMLTLASLIMSISVSSVVTRSKIRTLTLASESEQTEIEIYSIWVDRDRDHVNIYTYE